MDDILEQFNQSAAVTAASAEAAVSGAATRARP
jgi:hypothetical protein